MKLYNLTDHPSKTSSVIKIKGGRIFPGEFIHISEVDNKMLSSDLAVDVLPKWYSDWKNPPINKEYVDKLLTPKAEIEEIKEEKKPTKKK